MKAIQYIRISDKDQSNWSIEGQRKYNQMFADRHGLEIVDTYIDDGVSAKDFNRPQWRKLEERLQGRHGIKAVIVSKYDRLIRNLLEGLAFLDKAEKTYGVTIYSAMENFSIDPFSPMFFKIRADLFVNADFERRVISDRTSFGIWSSRSQGRLINRAPFGYINERDSTNKPIISIVPENAETVRLIYRSFLEGIPKTLILKMAIERGLRTKTNDIINRILRNPTYTGLIRVPAFKSEPSRMVEGVHAPIIDRDTWHRVQDELADHRPPRQDHDLLPLRGLLRCNECGQVMTGSRSKGKRKYYWYYRCMDCRCVNHNTDKVNALFTSVLSELSLKPSLIAAIKDGVTKQILQISKESDEKRRDINRAIAGKRQRLQKIEERYFNDKISDEVYQGWNRRLRQEIHDLQRQHEYYSKNFDSQLGHIDKHVHKLASLGSIYEAARATQKYRLINSLFDGIVMYSNTLIRTPSLTSVLVPNSQKIKGIEVVKEKDFKKEFPEVPCGSPNIIGIEHHTNIILTLKDIA